MNKYGVQERPSEKVFFDLMEKALSAYSNEHILHYFNRVKEVGLKEHGFPRLTANIGILIARGRRRDLMGIFLEMMDFCCKTIPTKKAANDFSVREIISCLREIEESGVVSKERTDLWRNELAKIVPETCYSKLAKKHDGTERNWALFSAVSEFFRQDAGLCDSADLIDLQLIQQMQWLDENGMYRDEDLSRYNPMVYDMVPRGLFSLLLDQGYRGKYYEAIDENLKKAGLCMLKMQSPDGELPFGGRSNQFLHNEVWMIAIFEFEAKRYAREGNPQLAASFKAAAERSMNVVKTWLLKQPILHIKNRFPTESFYGCEKYAYFDKYMITVASFLYVSYLIFDDTIPFDSCRDCAPVTFVTSDAFHKLFLKSGGYGLEFDWDADPHYDANGLGRIHREDAPGAIGLSCPCPAHPSYQIDIEEPFACSACGAVLDNGIWQFGAQEACKLEVLNHGTDSERAFASLRCRFPNQAILEETYVVEETGVSVTVRGEGTVGYVLPAFFFDGEKNTVISVGEQALTVAYEGWICRYTVHGKILDLHRTAANRNGHYRVFLATAEKELCVKIEIERE